MEKLTSWGWWGFDLHRHLEALSSTSRAGLYLRGQLSYTPQLFCGFARTFQGGRFPQLEACNGEMLLTACGKNPLNIKPRSDLTPEHYY